MKDDASHDRAGPGATRRGRVGAWIVVAVLSLLLIASAVLGYSGWTSSAANIPISGYIAMALGVVFSLLVGAGLMALIFYSSRKGYDEPAVLIEEPDTDSEDGQETSCGGRLRRRKSDL